jgi:dihydropteroate synthase
VLPVIRELKRTAPEAIISVDTYKASVARAAVAAGAEIVNDVSGLRWDPAMPQTVAELGCGVVLMHMRGRPEEWRTLPHLDAEEMFALVFRELGEWAAGAERAGIARESIAVDPGFGFGKILDENFPLLARFGELQRLGYPLLAGTSRKAFIGRAISRSVEAAPPAQRLYGTLASVTAAILQGAHVVRVHDVAPARDAAAIADAIIKAGGSRG